MTTPQVCVMGVSASGKSTVGALLATELGIPFIDGDDLHPEANRRKMAAGTPLTDDDRWPWLDVVGETFAAHAGDGVVIACSALRRVYRDRIRAIAPDVHFVLLDGSPELLAERAAARTGHFMPPALLQSQLDTLERPDVDEHASVVDVAEPVDTLIDRVIRDLR
ncbi:gluconokinase [Microbacterium gorillae]|uniref:gluconokinase n=1 Tax=Microbacterium gorillae TaxID=1231063 RepID=UPI003D982890